MSMASDRALNFGYITRHICGDLGPDFSVRSLQDRVRMGLVPFKGAPG